jgi:Fe-S-cluster-containing hydrogenase component 2
MYPVRGSSLPGILSGGSNPNRSVGKEACTGCRACVEACPYGVMFFDEDENFALKCDLCGGDPECVKNCAMGAIVLETSG